MKILGLKKFNDPKKQDLRNFKKKVLENGGREISKESFESKI